MEMVEQFHPNILLPFLEDDIITILNGKECSWNEIYTLFIIFADPGDKSEAEKYYNSYIKGHYKNTFNFDKVKKEMEEYLELMYRDLQELRDKFEEIQNLHLKEFNGLL